MFDDKIKKFENNKRLTELNPKNTLLKAGFNNNMVLCDIGAGTGIFSFPATEISNKNIYALEISDTMIQLLENRIIERNINNIIVKKVSDDILPLDKNSCDIVTLVTVFHEIKNKDMMINEIRRVLKEKARLMIIEFHKQKTPMGPPIEHRISEEQLYELFKNNNFKIADKFILGDNFYCAVFEKFTIG
ncbi:MAG: class I SAM-dependent methyltransferase [Clostridiales bacterium]